MHTTKIVIAALLSAVTLTCAAQANPAAPDGQQVVQAKQVAMTVGYSLGAMPEMQRLCGHTADQKRRTERVTEFLLQQFNKVGGTEAAGAFRQGRDASLRQGVELTAKMPMAELQVACNRMNAEFEPKLRAAEKSIPADFMPATKVAPAVKPAVKK